MLGVVLDCLQEGQEDSSEEMGLQEAEDMERVEQSCPDGETFEHVKGITGRDVQL